MILNDIAFLINENEKKPVIPPLDNISEYAENKRILPPNTPFPGPWDNSITPYLIEPMNNMSPHSDVQHTAVMKGAQIGFTAAAENIIAYWIDESPAEILYVSATEDLLEKWAVKRLDPMIDSCGFRHKIYAQTENKQSRRTGDKTFTKEFVGGTLDMASAQSAAGLRSDAKRILIRDEIDGAPRMLRTGEGDWLDVSYARTKAYGHRKKILDLSTPTVFGESLINDQFEWGDQRVYMVPCPRCKKYQKLVMGTDKSRHGLKGETKKGKIWKVYYLCDYCHKAFFNHNKTEMLRAGRWEPTGKSHSPLYRSYQISSLYSPVGMFSWEEVWLEYMKANEKPDGMRSFVNLVMGEPFKESGARPDIKKVIELRGNYRQGKAQEGVLFLTAGIDVQRGSETNENNPSRIEMEVVGHGAGYRTWSLDYKVFMGTVLDPYGGAWAALDKWARDGGLTYKRKDGKEFSVNMIFIDSGDGNVTDVVYRFAGTWQNTFPCKGFSALRRRKTEKGDEAGPSNFRRYRAARLNADIMLYEISTNYYKTHLYNNLKIGYQATGEQRPGFCAFPVDYDERFFRMLTAEEKHSDGSFHAGNRRNEALDCRVYALCAADVYLDALVMDHRVALKNAGGSPVDIQKVNHRLILDILKKNAK
jgi:phage terminase large subunit GpA-like protein